MLVQTKARIGIMSIALEAYMPQIEGLRETFQKQIARSREQYFNGNYELVDAGLVTVREDAEKAGTMFREKDVDVVFVQTMTYALSNMLVPAISNLNVPVVVFNLQSVKALDYKTLTELGEWVSDGFACGPVPEMTSTLYRMGKRYDVLTGYLEGDEAFKKQVEKWTTAAAVRARFRQTNAVMVGKQYTGMMDLYTSPSNLYNRLGIYYDSVDWEELWNIADDIDRNAPEVREKAEEMMEIFEFEGEQKVSDILNVAAYTLGFERLVKDRKISMLASMYEGFAQGKAGELDQVLHPIYSMLIKQGTACAVEGDIKVTIAMTILKALSGAGTLGELFSLDFHNDAILLGHSGSGDPDISFKKPVIREVDLFPGKIGGGYVTQFYPRPGDTTILGVSEQKDGTYGLVAAEGVVEEGLVMELGDTNQRTRFSTNIRDFVNEWAKAAPTHHFAMTCGRHIETIRCVAAILGIPLKVVCQ